MRWLACLGLVLTLIVTASPASSSCGADDCPVDLHGARSLNGRLTLDLSYQFIDQDQVRVGTRQSSVGALPSPEDEVRTVSRILTVRAQARLSDRLGISTSLPIVDRMHQHIANEDGSPGQLREWRYSGAGDLTVLGQLVALRTEGEWPTTLSLQLGVKLPTGLRHVGLVDGEEPEPSARPGTGSLDGLAGLHLMRAVPVVTLRHEPAEAPLFVSLLARTNGRGTDDYRIGDELQVNVGVGYPLSNSAQLTAQVNGRFRGKDGVGQTDALRDNTGGAWVYASPGLRVQTGPRFAWYGLVQIPVVDRVNRIQIVAPYHAMLGTSVRLGH